MCVYMELSRCGITTEFDYNETERLPAPFYEVCGEKLLGTRFYRCPDSAGLKGHKLS
jgi:hypothetical protein